MGIKGVAASVAAVGMVLSFPASAGGWSSAEKLRRLDIMLMVTGLRCRTTSDNFNREYGRFTTNHLSELNAASDSLKVEMAKKYGTQGANRALDLLSIFIIGVATSKKPEGPFKVEPNAIKGSYSIDP